VVRDSRYVIKLKSSIVLIDTRIARIAMPPIKNLKMSISTAQTRHCDTARDGPLAVGSIIIGMELHDASNPN
jgi:hypothetical protein